jgi:hypothetical protein
MLQLLKRKPKEIKVSEIVRTKLMAVDRLTDEQLREKYEKLYYSEYVAKNQPWILETPCDEWIEKQMELRKVSVR